VNHSKPTALLLLAAVIAAAVTVDAAPLMYRPGREYRTINTGSYEVVFQKNGCLGVNLLSGEPVFRGACPMIWFEGKEGPEPLEIDGRWSMRQEVNDRLGKGQGMLLAKEECEWSIRTYTPATFLCTQVAYTNDTKKPVRVRMLIPWHVGEHRKSMLSLGDGTDQTIILENSGEPGRPTNLRLAAGSASSLWNVALLNPTNGRSLAAGFLTHGKAFTEFRAGRSEDAEETEFSLFEAACVYDPPIELAPGERLSSEVLYLGVSESHVLTGLERLGDAVAVANRVPRRKPFLPHGWDSTASEYGTAITETAILDALQAVDAKLKRYGWTHFTVGRGWERAAGDWAPDAARFSDGMKAVAGEIHARDMTAGIEMNPFLVSRDAPMARQHPEWVAEPLEAWRNWLEPGVGILDVTAPGAEDYLRGLVHEVSHEWGYDAIEGVDAGVLLGAATFADPDLTRVEVLQRGLLAIDESLGADKVMTGAPPLPIVGPRAVAVGHGDPVAPVWRRTTLGGPMGAVEALTDAAEHYYFSPFLFAGDPGCAYFGHEATRQRWQAASLPELTWNQKLAWFTGLALSGGVVKFGDSPLTLTSPELAVLQKLLPPLDASARPVDLFGNEKPQIWSVPVRSAIGDWVLVALFNWDEGASQKLPLNLAHHGLNPEGYYTVYGFWEETYYGIAHRQLTVAVPPGGVRLLTLRPYEDHPMFLSTDRHYSQGATDFTALQWKEGENQLSGAFQAVGKMDYALRILVPEGYQTASATVSSAPVQTAQDGAILTMRFQCAHPGPVSWAVTFNHSE
jgi:hypothetical protein